MVLKKIYQYGIALLLPVVATGVALFTQQLIPAGNVELLYIVAVIVTAVNTGTKQAMLAAFVSFISINYFFTEPRYSLLVLHPPDVLTIVLFVVVAALVGHLAARLREQLEKLQNRERFSNIELIYMEKLAVAISSDHVLSALSEALDSAVNLQYWLLRITDGNVAFSREQDFDARAMQQRIQTALASNVDFGDKPLVQDELNTARLLTDTRDNIAVLITRKASEASGNGDYINLLLHQANLALGRTRLVRDLEVEKLDKEQEVIRSSLLSSVSHDFRTPLTSMIGATSTLLEMGSSLQEDQQKELLESVLLEATRLNGYTQKLLDMTRLGRGELKLNRSTLSIEEILNVVVKRFRREGRDDRLALEVTPNIPLLNVHAALIEQALYNVLENGMKFSPPQSCVTLRARACEQFLVVEIEDAGPGIPLSERDKVFEMFHSADRGDRRTAGTGLGLAICKGMIGAHGGAVEIQDSATGSGCVVEIRLPLGTQSDARS